jgi:2-polyprenyl-6-methoxyphenol hydroxylase-like FAD-dependent oxidoreductase
VAPPRAHGGGNLDYLGYATFYAEHGHYALTLCCLEQDTELTPLVSRPEGFESVCSQLPTLKLWTSISVPTTKVLGAGRFENRWRKLDTRGKQSVVGLFLLGDSQLQTNPMYGRGCASAFVQASVLSEVLQAHRDPEARATHYYARSHELLHPYFELSVATDRLYRMRARLRNGELVTPAEKLIDYAYENAWLPATYRYPLMAREFLRSVQMREISSPWLRLLAVWFLFSAWLANRFQASAASESVPPRSEFLAAVGAQVRTLKASVRPKAQLEMRLSDPE